MLNFAGGGDLVAVDPQQIAAMQDRAEGAPSKGTAEALCECKHRMVEHAGLAHDGGCPYSGCACLGGRPKDASPPPSADAGFSGKRRDKFIFSNENFSPPVSRVLSRQNDGRSQREQPQNQTDFTPPSEIQPGGCPQNGGA
jgi:hypothetical protein